MNTLYDINVTTLNGKATTLNDYAGQVILIVNTASQCGFTSQYQGLEKLYKQYREQGLVVLGFPCNQFGGQEPGNEQQIGAFCEQHYGVTFPLFSKIDVNGKDAHPLYIYLKKQVFGLFGSRAIKWNFTKFLINKEGRVVKRYAPITKPEKIDKAIQKLLAEKN